MYLARARFEGEKYELRSLDAGKIDPAGHDGDGALQALTEEVFYEEMYGLGDEEKPDGEYIVMAFDEDNVRFDFFLGEGLENMIREVRTMDDGEEIETFFRANFKDTEKTSTGIMKEWIDHMND